MRDSGTWDLAPKIRMLDTPLAEQSTAHSREPFRVKLPAIAFSGSLARKLCGTEQPLRMRPLLTWDGNFENTAGANLTIGSARTFTDITTNPDSATIASDRNNLGLITFLNLM